MHYFLIRNLRAHGHRSCLWIDFQ